MQIHQGYKCNPESQKWVSLIEYSVDLGQFKELIDLLNQALTVDPAHKAMFSELGVLLTKYRSEQMMEQRYHILCYNHDRRHGHQ